MRMLRFFWILSFAVMLAGPVFADSLRCPGGYVVITGDSEDDVMEKCGEPTYTEDNKWIYDFGDPDTVTVIQFGAGGEFRRKVTSIKKVGRE
jgi:hypothetical protein